MARWIAAALAACMVLPVFAQDEAPAPDAAVAAIPTNSAPPLFIRITDLGKFEVVMHRTETTGVGGVVGGMLGATIQMAAYVAADSRETAKIKALLTEPDCGLPLTRAMIDSLNGSGKYRVVPDELADAGIVSIGIAECGLRLVDSTAKKLSAYVAINLEYAPAGPERKWKQKIQVSSSRSYSISEFQGVEGLAQSELNEALRRASSRAANKVIFYKGE